MGDIDAQALIDAIVANPDDLAPWTTYADWLLDRGDLRGELINLEVAREAGNFDPAMTERIGELNCHEEQLLSPPLAACSHLWKLAFRRGFIHDARCLVGPADARADASAVAALVADPHAALLAAVDVWTLWEPLLAAPPRSLRSLTVTDLGEGASRLDDRLPGLETLLLVGDVTVATLNHRALRRLVTFENACRAITTGAFQLPNLEELSIFLDGYDPDDTWHDDQLDDALFDGAFLWRPPPRLRILCLDGSFDVATLADCPLLAQLTRLSLSNVTLDDLDAILLHARAFRRLATLQLDLREPDASKRLDPDELHRLGDRFAAALPATSVDADWSRLGDHAPLIARHF